MHTEFWQINFLEKCHLEEGDERIMIRYILLKEARKLVGGQ